MNVIDMVGMQERLAALRAEAAALMSQINTAYLPTPVRSSHPNFPGSVWSVGRRHDQWNVYVVPGQEDVLYVHHPGDMPGDVQPMEIDYAQDVAMALLAACHHANLHRQSPPELPVVAAARRKTGRIPTE